KNGHAPPPIESRKSYQSVNPYYVRTCYMWTPNPPRERRTEIHTRSDGGVLYSTSPNRWSASFMVKTTTVSDRLRSPNFRTGIQKEGTGGPVDTLVLQRTEPATPHTTGLTRRCMTLYINECASLNPTTSFLTATTLIYAIGAGITAAAGTRLALQLLLVKGFKLYSFQLQ
ncbi:hypothetical protein Angca_000661, partial [Angiostrongylus cantonensis]